MCCVCAHFATLGVEAGPGPRPIQLNLVPPLSSRCRLGKGERARKSAGRKGRQKSATSPCWRVARTSRATKRKKWLLIKIQIGGFCESYLALRVPVPLGVCPGVYCVRYRYRVWWAMGGRARAACLSAERLALRGNEQEWWCSSRRGPSNV